MAPIAIPAPIACIPGSRPRYPAINAISFPSPAPIIPIRNNKYAGINMIVADQRNSVFLNHKPINTPANSHRFLTLPQQRSVQPAPYRNIQRIKTVTFPPPLSCAFKILLYGKLCRNGSSINQESCALEQAPIVFLLCTFFPLLSIPFFNFFHVYNEQFWLDFPRFFS